MSHPLLSRRTQDRDKVRTPGGRCCLSSLIRGSMRLPGTPGTPESPRFRRYCLCAEVDLRNLLHSWILWIELLGVFRISVGEHPSCQVVCFFFRLWGSTSSPSVTAPPHSPFSQGAMFLVHYYWGVLQNFAIVKILDAFFFWFGELVLIFFKTNVLRG